jgi:hypothetical protein
VRGVQENGSYVVAVKGANGEEVSHCCYTVVTLLSHCWYTLVTLLLHLGDGEDGTAQYHQSTGAEHPSLCGGIRGVSTLLLNCCYTVVTLLLHCC